MVLPTEIGVVGLGKMGGSMARHLIDEGWAVFGYDVDEAARTQAEDYGVTITDSPAALASRVKYVVTSLPTTESVEAVYRGTDGLVSGGGEDLVAFEMSTVAPETSEQIGASTDRLTLLDAPVSGGTERARDGTLTVMVGADRSVFEREQVQAVLHALGENIYYMGGVGAGHTTKLLNNLIGAGVRAVFLEATAVAAVREVEWDAFMQVIRHSSGSSYQFRKKMPKILNREFKAGFAMETAMKDLRLALEMGDSTNTPTFVTSIVYELHKQAVAEGFGDEDTAALAKIFEENADVVIESDEPIDNNVLDWEQI